MTRWLSHWGLRETPFSKEISDADLWVPASRTAAIERLVEACRERGHALLAGEPGVGKTCVLRALRSRLPEAGFRLTYCHNVTLGRRDFYRHVCLALGLSPKATAAAVFYAISTHIAELGRDNVHPVLLIDSCGVPGNVESTPSCRAPQAQRAGDAPHYWEAGSVTGLPATGGCWRPSARPRRRERSRQRGRPSRGPLAWSRG